MEREVREVWQGAELPEWIRLLPLGTVELADDREPFEVDREALANMVEGFQSRGVDLVVDYEHQSLKGDRAPAAGWIKGLEARGDGLWARVEWTAQAGEYLRQREYRYFSPVLKLDPATRRPVNLMNVALTNVPAIKGLTPLVARWGGAPVEGRSLPPGSGASMETGKEKAVRLQELRARLGLTSEAQEEALWQTAEEVLRDLAQAAGLAEDAPASRLKGGIKALRVTSEKYGALEAELETLKARVKEEEASRAVEAALQAGKISPAQKAWALMYCRQDREGFDAYVAKAPKVVPVGEKLLLAREATPEPGGLSPEERAICRAMNITPETYLKAKAEMEQAK